MTAFMENIMKLYGKTYETRVNTYREFTMIVEGRTHCHRAIRSFSNWSIDSVHF